MYGKVCTVFCSLCTGEILHSVPEVGVLVTGGEVKVGLWWGVDGEERVMCPPGLESAKETSPHTGNLAALKKWAGTHVCSTTYMYTYMYTYIRMLIIIHAFIQLPSHFQ